MSQSKQGSGKRGGAMSLLITLLVIGLIGALAFIAVDKAISTQNVDYSYINPWVAQHKIVYECRDAFGASQLCLVHSDGSGQRQLTFGGNSGVEYFKPQINAVGQVVSQCIDRQRDLAHYCLFHVDRPEEIRHVGEPQSLDSGIQINDFGDIYFDCGDDEHPRGTQLCLSTEQQPAGAAISTSDGSGPVRGWVFDLNDTGGIGYRCYRDDPMELCIRNLQTGEELVFRAAPDSAVVEIEDLVLANNSELAALCRVRQQNGRLSSRICLTDATSGTYSAAAEHGSEIIELAGFNSRGEVAFACQENSDDGVNICMYDSTDGSAHNLTAGLSISSVGHADLNELGMMVFRCDHDICVMNSNGTGFRLLTNHTAERPASHPHIQ